MLLLDGARYHTGSRVREYLRKLELDVIWSGPYSYSTAPIEMVFGSLKFGELNPDKKPTGKRVSTTFFITDSVVFRSGGGHGGCKTHGDSQEYLHQILAPHDPEPVQVLILRAGLRTMDWSSQEMLDILLVETTIALKDIDREVHDSPMSIGQKDQIFEYCRESKD